MELSSKERVRRLIMGQEIDRTPVFDLLRNDAAIEYYSGEKITFDNAQELVFRAVSKALDATRPNIKAPVPDKHLVLDDGRKSRIMRWTTWTEEKTFEDEDAYSKYLEQNYSINNDEKVKQKVEAAISRHMMFEKQIGDVFLFWSTSGPGLQMLFGEVGLEAFSYYLYDCPDAIANAFEANTQNAINFIKRMHEVTKNETVKPEVYFISEDMAFKSGCIFSAEFMKREFYPRLKRIVQCVHETGKKVCFHSDGNLMNCLSDLIDCGIDILNPIETIAGMDIASIHKQYPKLIMTGGIDVSQLLPYGTPEIIEEAAFKAIKDSDGKIMIGSSTEMHHGVPLENVIALYNAPGKFASAGK